MATDKRIVKVARKIYADFVKQAHGAVRAWSPEEKRLWMAIAGRAANLFASEQHASAGESLRNGSVQTGETPGSTAASGLDMPTIAAQNALSDYGRSVGWLRSRLEFSAIDSEGNPTPWYTYPAIAFLSRAVTPPLRVFEFGTGNSTLWWAARVRSVTSVEHDKVWAQKVEPRLPPNVNYRWIALKQDGDYCRSAQSSGSAYDIIVIDGKDRWRCTTNSIGCLAAGGVIVWDNADVVKYQPLFEDLCSQGFKRLPFVGHGPIRARSWETSIFYRSDNCLGI
ncbi:hypothetical protein BH10PSE6_BH10PSE6_04660 [soil metagenome]